jgi:hypothetical protein
MNEITIDFIEQFGIIKMPQSASPAPAYAMHRLLSGFRRRSAVEPVIHHAKLSIRWEEIISSDKPEM